MLSERYALSAFANAKVVSTERRDNINSKLVASKESLQLGIVHHTIQLVL